MKKNHVSKTGQGPWGGDRMGGYAPKKTDSSKGGTRSAYRLPSGSKLGFKCDKADPTNRGSKAGPKS